MPDGQTGQRLAAAHVRDHARELHIEGERWLVYIHAPSLVPGAQWSLVFEGQSAVRRVREFPPNWRELSDVELYAVSRRR